MEFRKTITRGALPLAIAALSLTGARSATAQFARDAHSMLVLESAVPGSARSLTLAAAAELGYTIEFATDQEWISRTAQEFASYRLLVTGDPSCGAQGPFAVAESTKSVWSPAIQGNVVVLPASTNFLGRVRDGGTLLTTRSTRFAAEGPATGLLLVNTCETTEHPVLLAPYGTMSVVGQGRCPEEAEVLAVTAGDPRLADLPEARYASMGCPDFSPRKDWIELNTDTRILTGHGDPGGRGPVLTRSASTTVEAPVGVRRDGRILRSGPTATTTLNFNGNATLQSFSANGICDDCAPDALFNGDVVGLGVRATLNVNAKWHPTATIEHLYSPSLLRQGENFTMQNTLKPGSGPLDVTYALSGDFGVYFMNTFPGNASVRNTFPIPAVSQTGTGTCSMKLDGDGTYSCSATKTFDIYEGDLFGIASVKITLPVTTSLSMTPDGVFMVREVSVGNSVIVPSAAYDFHGPSPSKKTDAFVIACTAPVGTGAVYDMGQINSTPTAVATTEVKVGLKVVVVVTIFNDTFSIATFGPSPAVALPLSAGGESLDLGPILPDNSPPVVDAGGPYLLKLEGTPVQFSSAGTTDNCSATLAYVWNYSDLGIAYGPSPFHTFGDNAIYSGQLVVTDLAGNSAAQSFSVEVLNVAPDAQAGPNTTAPWGTPVTLNGQGTDPGSDDQSTLTYSWTFGDGSPSATGGPSVAHSYTTPGLYTADLTICDKDGDCTTDSRDTIVRKRDVSLGYLGDHTGVYDSYSSLAASLVDELGATVNARTVDFSVGTESSSSATNSSGIALRSHLLGLNAGSTLVTAAFAGDALYGTATPYSAAYTVTKNATSVSYTGDLSGNPNKFVPVSAILLDVNGKPLAGRTLTFVLSGSPSASAVTDVNGLATTQVKTSNPGSYALTVTFTATGADTSRYIGSVDSETYTVQH